jgi:hypothetical protein
VRSERHDFDALGLTQPHHTQAAIPQLELVVTCDRLKFVYRMSAS